MFFSKLHKRKEDGDLKGLRDRGAAACLPARLQLNTDLCGAA